ncbi:uncharacterized protein PG986_004474 [Apiospora aurea]|uniref:Short-chain dehydrogenase n=1 Tax=Apiospora aurea TaxID=335848 RepID=A0ABR1QNF5_9PEZI
MPGTVSFIKQSFPGKPTFTDENVPDLTNKVIIVTSSNTGLGKEIARIVYSKNAKVYMMARSREKTLKARKDIEAAVPKSGGELIFLPLDLSDLTQVKKSVIAFLAREHQLHILFNNAGVGYPEKGSKTKQGYEPQLGVNCISTFAFTKLLTPTLVSTAKASPANSVRVVWVTSSAAEATSPQGFVENLPKVDKMGAFEQYSISKLSNYFHATEFAARHRADGVLSLPLNPGNLDSEFWRTQGSLMTCILQKTHLYPPVFGAYTNLFAAFSPQVTLEKSGTLTNSNKPAAPWGQFWNVAPEMLAGAKTKAEGGTNIAGDFWSWTEAQVRSYL